MFAIHPVATLIALQVSRSLILFSLGLMRAIFDFVLLVAGVVVPFSIFGSVLLSQSRSYYAWAKLVSLLGGIAALTWGGVEAVVLYLPVRRHTLDLLEASRLAVAVCCLTCIFALLIARRYNRLEIDTGKA